MEALLERITFDPEVLGGKPVIRGLRLSVAMILELLAKGATPEEILADYPLLEPEDLQAALLYAHHLVAGEVITGAGWLDSYRPITIDLKGAVCVLTSITAKEYCDFFFQSLPVCEDYSFYLALDLQLKCKASDFYYPRLYAALKTLFGESTTVYDDYKCSFGYPFILKIIRKDKKSVYALNFMDTKGGISFMFRKILATPEEIERYKDKDRLLLYEPFEDDFSRDEMAYFMTWFVFYLKGFMQSFEGHYQEEFARSLDYCFMIYGYRDNQFFLDQYEDYDEFYAAAHSMLKSGDIPFNRVKTNYFHGKYYGEHQ